MRDQVRTDLALEATESIKKEASSNISGIEVHEHKENDDVFVTRVLVQTKNAAKSLGKPIGTYVTIESATLEEGDYEREIAKVIAKEIQKILPDLSRQQSVLVIGLGNKDVTADALGPCVVDHLMITRHLIKQYGNQAFEETKHLISSLVPGVMAKTGMETAEIVKGVISETKPDFIIVVDALAARTTHRLHRTVQITDTGINPGSGVGNYRHALTKESLGVPVISIGIPMVVDANVIVQDALEKLERTQEQGREIFRFFLNNQDTYLHKMYVTVKDIDEMTRKLSFTLAEAINMALE